LSVGRQVVRADHAALPLLTRLLNRYVPLEGINFVWLNWWLIVPALIVGVLWSYAATPLLTRWLNLYVRLEGPPE
jgi:hypothetical protein